MKGNAKKMVLTRSENEHYLLENSIMRTFSNIFQMENPKFPVVFLLVNLSIQKTTVHWLHTVA